MSAPNRSYDPVEVTPLHPDEIARMVDEKARPTSRRRPTSTCYAAWPTDGDRSPLALANPEIGALPPAARAEAGKRVGAARGTVRSAIEERRQVLEAGATLASWKAVDVTLPWDREPIGAQHPLTLIRDRVSDVFVAMG